jgi:hypothetical protein
MNAHQPAVVSEYKGQPLIALNAGSRWPFQLGLGKAKTILEHIEAIRAFVESEGKSVSADVEVAQ